MRMEQLLILLMLLVAKAVRKLLVAEVAMAIQKVVMQAALELVGMELLTVPAHLQVLVDPADMAEAVEDAMALITLPVAEADQVL